MLSNRPYLLRAFYQWIVDSACAPILVINANHPRCKIPLDYAEGGEIVFNISSTAVRDLKMTNESIEFKASFSGVIHIVYAPINAIHALYAEENGEGIFFDGEEEGADESVARLVPLKSVEVDRSTVQSLETNMTAADVTGKCKPVLRLVE